MKKNDMMKWGIGAAVLLGLGAVAMGSAQAAQEGEDDNAGKGLEDSGIRHGIRYEGCAHFDLVDPDAIEAWGRSNVLRFAKWIPKLDELRADPEPAIIEAMTMLFPECSWPPSSSTTFGPDRVEWAEAIQAATEAAQNLDLAGGAGSTGDPQAVAGTMLGKALAFGLRAQPLRWRRRRG